MQRSLIFYWRVLLPFLLLLLVGLNRLSANAQCIIVPQPKIIFEQDIRLLDLVIRSPWWAVVGYVLVVAGIGYALIRYHLKHQEAQQLKIFDAMKARFFTNITHEFRTPLTLILGLSEQLKQRLHHPDDKHHINTIYHNTNQLLGLINQLMELSGVESSTLRVAEIQGNLAAPVSIAAILLKTESQQKINNKEQKQNAAPVILLVEDNVALGDLISESLPDSYQIYRALNGAEGLSQAFNIVPDLVISDVLMPIMDGYTFCRRLKEDPRTRHISFILLTAKSSVDSRLEGLAVGADDYITKPFNIQELQLRIRNLLEQRQQLRNWVLSNMTSVDLLPNASTDPLLEKLSQLVEDHLDESSFGAEELTLASGMSRMNLHRKLKALTDTSTGEFIRNYRLKRATQLLLQGHSVAETAYLVGFEDPSYFARSFRKVYETTPSAFAQAN